MHAYNPHLVDMKPITHQEVGHISFKEKNKLVTLESILELGSLQIKFRKKFELYFEGRKKLKNSYRSLII